MADLREALADALRPVVRDIVSDFVAEMRPLLEPPPREDERYWTVKEYAAEHRTTPHAVRQRIQRGTLDARRPEGSREWLIPRQGA
jgi:hypothetical protein